MIGKTPARNEIDSTDQRHSRSSKRWRILGVALLLLIAAGVPLLVGIPVPGLRNLIAEAAERKLGVEITGGRVRFHLLEGVQLEDAEATALTEGRRYHARLPHVRLGHDLRTLLSGVVEIRRVLLESPKLEITELAENQHETRPEASRPARDEPGSAWVSFDIDEVVMSGGSIVLSDASREPDEADDELEGVDIRLDELELRTDGERAGSILALEGSGEFRAREGHLGDVDILQARSQIYFHEGNVSLTLLNFATASAPFVAEVRVELGGAPFDYTASMLGEPFDPAPIAGGEAGGLGKASLLLEVFGSGPTAEGFRAQGSVTLPAGTLPRLPILVAVNDFLGREVFPIGGSYRQTMAEIRVRDGYVLFQPFELATDRAVATFRGRAYLNGKLEMELILRQSAGDAAGDVLELVGTAENPVVRKPPTH